MPPGRQRTFDLVPTTLVRSTGPKPPMTSKAAKKAYKEANRGPKISRAEQRRLDAEELDRQKKEYEKERASAKARAAREKKAAKAEAERAERKKLGLPEPSRFVRASQPTISRFVKSNGKRDWQEMEGVAEDSDDTVNHEEVQDKSERPAKQVGLGSNDMHEIDSVERHSPARGAVIRPQADDEFGNFPSWFQTDILDTVSASLLYVHGNTPKQPSPTREEAQELPKLPAQKSLKLPSNKISKDAYPLSSQELAAMVNTQVLSEAADAASKSDAIEPPVSFPHTQKSSKSTHTSPPTNKVLVVSEVKIGEKNGSMPPPLINRQTTMPPPSRAPTIHGLKSLSFAIPPARTQSVNQKLSPASRHEPSLPPPSTQAFLENNLDDFLPSPSQERRELDMDVNDSNSDAQIAEHGPAKAEALPQAEIGDLDNFFCFCTQDLILSSQDLLEISPMRENPKAKSVQDVSKGVHFDDLLSSQELVLSEQDLEEIETPSRAPSKTVHNLSPELRFLLGDTSATTGVGAHNTVEPKATVHQLLKEVTPSSHKDQKPRLRIKPRFFEEKEDDMVHAAITESRQLSLKRNIRPSLHSKEALSKAASSLTEEQQVQAAIEESRRMAEKSSNHQNRDLLKLPVKPTKLPETRKLSRTISFTTDYGDDDFADITAADLEGFC